MRIQLGVSIECLLDPTQKSLLTKEWTHLGSSVVPSRQSLARARRRSPGGAVRHALDFFAGGRRFNRLMKGIADGVAMVPSLTSFVNYFYDTRTGLPFHDDSVTFIYSEHFFEHLFLDEVGGLLKECHRVLAQGGVIRTVLPDADLRTYEPIEPAGFTAGGDSWNDPQKHKSRWSVYSFSYMLGQSGFIAAPFVYCNRNGEFIRKLPDPKSTPYHGCLDKQLIRRTDYIKRLDRSLCIDGIKA